MQTMVDNSGRPAQPCDSRRGERRFHSRRGLIRVLVVAATASIFATSVVQSQTATPPAATGPQSKSSKTSKKSPVPANEQPETPPQSELTALSLEEMLATALKHNPDIRVAEAKLREAESELNRVRLDVAKKVMVFRSQWEAEKANVQLQEEQFKQTVKLLEKQALSQEQYRFFQMDLQVKRAALTKLEAELPYLLGRAPRDAPSSGASAPVTRTYALNALPSEDFLAELHKILKEVDSEATFEFFQPSLSLIIRGSPRAHTVAASVLLAVKRGSQPVAARSRARSEMEEKIFKALDTTFEGSIRDKPLDELLKAFRTSFGIPFVADPPSFDTPDGFPKVSLDLGEVPLAIMLQAIQDTHRVYFSVREYGIHVSTSTQLWREGSGAVDFWKREKERGEKYRTDD